MGIYIRIHINKYQAEAMHLTFPQKRSSFKNRFVNLASNQRKTADSNTVHFHYSFRLPVMTL